MRQSILVLFFTLFVVNLFGQTTWSTSKKDLGNGEYLITHTAEIQPGWWTYSNLTSQDVIPATNEVGIDETPAGLTVEDAIESSKNRKKTFDKVFGAEVVKFTKQAIYTQKVKVSADYDGKPLVGYIYYMTCNDEKCMPPSYYDFSLTFDKPTKTKTTTINKNKK